LDYREQGAGSREQGNAIASFQTDSISRMISNAMVLKSRYAIAFNNNTLKMDNL